MEESGIARWDSESDTYLSARTIGIDFGRRFDRQDSGYLVEQGAAGSRIPMCPPNVDVPLKRHPIPREVPARLNRT